MNQFDKYKSIETLAPDLPSGRKFLPWRFLIFAVFLFGLSIFIFIGLRFGYGSYLNLQSSALDKNIKKLGSELSNKEQLRLISLYSQLINLQKLLKEHQFTANIFSFLEKNTTNSVYYTASDSSFDDASAELKLSGQTLSLKEVTEQLAVFDRLPEVQEVRLENLGFNNLGVSFNVSVNLNSNFFEKPQE